MASIIIRMQVQRFYYFIVSGERGKYNDVFPITVNGWTFRCPQSLLVHIVQVIHYFLNGIATQPPYGWEGRRIFIITKGLLISNSPWTCLLVVKGIPGINKTNKKCFQFQFFSVSVVSDFSLQGYLSRFASY